MILPPADDYTMQKQRAVVGQFDVEAALRRHLVRQVTDKLAATSPAARGRAVPTFPDVFDRDSIQKPAAPRACPGGRMRV